MIMKGLLSHLGCFVVAGLVVMSHMTGPLVAATSSVGRGLGGLSEQSQESYADIFHEIDQNGNGNVSPDEIKQFIVSTGGSSLDEEVEIDDAVHNVLLSLDGNHDETVKLGDLAQFWVSQASMLSVEDVFEWVLHSLHLPIEVANIIRSNAITGFDFPDLLKNKGQLIETELGISKKTFKNRLYRGLAMRLIGMGRVPPELSGFTFSSISCTELKLMWNVERSDSVGFPIHKFLVERFDPEMSLKSNSFPMLDNRVLSVDTSQSGEATKVIDPMANLNAHAYQPQWRVISSDMNTFTIDTNLEPGARYRYRVSAWNMIGRSEYLFLQASTGSNCTRSASWGNASFAELTLPQLNIVESIGIVITTVLQAIPYMYLIVQFLFSWSYFISIWVINGFFLIEFLYRIVINAERTQVAAVEEASLASSPTTEEVTHQRMIKPFGFRIAISENIISRLIAVREWLQDYIFMRVMRRFASEETRCTVDRMFASLSPNIANPTGEIHIMNTPVSPVRPPMLVRMNSESTNCSQLTTTTESTRTPPFNRYQEGSQHSAEKEKDVYRYCCICSKKFSMAKRRVRHYCFKCLRHFCKNCAHHVSHQWPWPCKIKGDCLCKDCGEEMK